MQFNDKWDNGLKGYLKFMEPRLIDMHRLLKDTGSIYRHCQTETQATTSRFMMDGPPGIQHFRNCRLFGLIRRVRRTQSNSHDTMRLFCGNVQIGQMDI